MPMQIYIIQTEIHQWEYTWRLTSVTSNNLISNPTPLKSIRVNHTQLNVN